MRTRPRAGRRTWGPCRRPRPRCRRWPRSRSTARRLVSRTGASVTLYPLLGDDPGTARPTLSVPHGPTRAHVTRADARDGPAAAPEPARHADRAYLSFRY